MRSAHISVCGKLAARLDEIEPGRLYRLSYLPEYDGPPVSLTLPTSSREYSFTRFPPFFDGLLPEGTMLEGLLKQLKVDKTDYFGQLVAVGADLVGAVTVKEIPE